MTMTVRLGEHLLELHQVPEVGAAGFVDRVVGDQVPRRTKLWVRVDVEVVDGYVEVDRLDIGDYVERARASSTITMPATHRSKQV